MLVFGAVAGVGLGWLTTAAFHANLARTLTAEAVRAAGALWQRCGLWCGSRARHEGVARTLVDGRPGISETLRI